MSDRPEVLFHINPREWASWRGRERLAIFTRIARLCDSHAIPYRAISRPRNETDPKEAPADGNLHIVEGGAVRGEGWLNTALAYLIGFWHLDPEGIQARSSARHAIFDPTVIDKATAMPFLRGLQRRFLRDRLSRFHQPRKLATNLPQGAVAVFLQGESAYRIGNCTLPAHEMILAVCRAAGERPVIVKPHPQVREHGAEAVEIARQMGATITVTTANVHDVLHAAAVTVSINSAVAIEGLMHRRPAILLGASDFENLAVRASGAEDLPRALATALDRRWPYAKMLYWYYSQHALDLTAPDFDTRCLAAFASVGFPKERLLG
jgi:Capsule polysaccharide biosynthesis protein